MISIAQQTLEDGNAMRETAVGNVHSHMVSWRPCRSQQQPHRGQRRTPALRTATPTPRTIDQQTQNQSNSQIKTIQTHMTLQCATYLIRSILPCRCAGRGGRCRVPGRACRYPTPARRSRAAATQRENSPDPIDLRRKFTGRG